jgi:hypothetical protein
MPSSYEIDKQKRLVVATAWGVCTIDDVLQFRKRVLSDRDFDPSFAQLADLTHITKVEMTPDEIRMIAAVSPFSSNSRRAIVAQDHIVFGFSKMFGILRGLRGEKLLRVFRDRSEAMEWLLEEQKAA